MIQKSTLRELMLENVNGARKLTPTGEKYKQMYMFVQYCEDNDCFNDDYIRRQIAIADNKIKTLRKQLNDYSELNSPYGNNGDYKRGLNKINTQLKEAKQYKSNLVFILDDHEKPKKKTKRVKKQLETA